MTLQEWKTLIAGLDAVSQIHADNPEASARRLLVDCYIAALAAPDDLLVRFSGINSEDRFDARKKKYAEFMRGHFALSLIGAESDIDILTALADFLSSLDRFLFEQQIDYGTPPNPEDRWGVSTGHNEAYLIPCAGRRSSGKRQGDSGRGAFIHKVLQYHRVLPKVIGSYSLKLVPTDLPVRRDSSPTNVAGKKANRQMPGAESSISVYYSGF